MDKTELKNKLEEVKNLIITNSKDSHWAKNAIDELLSLKGQLDHEPTIMHLPIKNIEKSLSSDTFEMHVMKDGTAVYHVYGGLTITAAPNLQSLNGTITEYVNSQEYVTTMNEEDKEAFDLDLSAFGYIMSLPMLAFSDPEFKYNIASTIVQYLREKSEDLLAQELKEETIEDAQDNQRFKDATLALEELNEEIKKASI
jgi:hypothetical protein